MELTIEEVRLHVLTNLIQTKDKHEQMHTLVRQANEAIDFIYGKKDEPTKPAPLTNQEVINTAIKMEIPLDDIIRAYSTVFIPVPTAHEKQDGSPS